VRYLNRPSSKHMHHETKNLPMLSALSLPNHGQTRRPTKRRVYITHRPLNSPGRLSHAAVWATKYTAHQPHTKTPSVSMLLLHQLPYEANWLSPRPLLADRHCLLIEDAARTANLPTSPKLHQLLARLYTAAETQNYWCQIITHTHNNNRGEHPILHHNQQG